MKEKARGASSPIAPSCATRAEELEREDDVRVAERAAYVVPGVREPDPLRVARDLAKRVVALVAERKAWLPRHVRPGRPHERDASLANDPTRRTTGNRLVRDVPIERGKELPAHVLVLDLCEAAVRFGRVRHRERRRARRPPSQPSLSTQPLNPGPRATPAKRRRVRKAARSGAGARRPPPPTPRCPAPGSPTRERGRGRGRPPSS